MRQKEISTLAINTLSIITLFFASIALLSNLLPNLPIFNSINLIATTNPVSIGYILSAFILLMRNHKTGSLIAYILIIYTGTILTLYSLDIFGSNLSQGLTNSISISPSTLICLLLSALIILICKSKTTHPLKTLTILIMSSYILLTAIITIATLMGNIQIIYGWSHIASIKNNAAYLLLLNATTLFIYTLTKIEQSKNPSHIIFPMFIFISGVLVMFFVWQGMMNNEYRNVNLSLNQAANDIEGVIKDTLNERIEDLKQAGDYIQAKKISDQEISAKNLLAILFKKKLSYLSFYRYTKGQIKPIIENNTVTHQLTNKALRSTIEHPEKAFFFKNKLLYAVKLSHQNDFLLTTINLSKFAQAVYPTKLSAYWYIKIMHQNNVLYADKTAQNSYIEKRWSKILHFDIAGASLTVSVIPKKEYLLTLFSNIPSVITIFSFLLFALLSYLLSLWLSIKDANIIAESASKAKSNFLSSMSHELRTPLNAIVGYSELLANDKTLTLKQKENAKNIESSSNHLLSLINDILDLSKIEAGKIYLNMTTVNVTELLSSCINICKPLIDQRHISLKFNPHKASQSYITTDLQKAKQILLNLISNAIKYNKEKGTLTVKTTTENNLIKITIADTGAGIPKNKMKQIFEPFERLGTEKTNIQGTGIGLLITKNLVEHLNSSLSIESEVGIGTSITVTFPKANISLNTINNDELQSKTTKTEIDHTSDIKNTLHVLLAEDNIVNQEILRQQSKQLNINLDIANNGHEALEKFKERKYDLILMDCNMPTMDGFIATKKIRALENDNTIQTPIIAFTANAYPEDITKCYSAGMNDVLVKPVQISTLQQMINLWGKRVIDRVTDNPPVISETIHLESIHFDIQQLKNNVGENPLVLQTILKKFLSTMLAAHDQIQQLFLTRSYAEIRSEAHKLKSSSKGVGALTLADLCIQLEKAASTNNIKVLEQTIHLINNEVTTVNQLIESRFL